MGVALVPSQTTTGNGTLVVPEPLKPARWRAGQFQLHVSAAAAQAGDTLNVYVQSSCDGGNTWDDFISFTQILGNGGAKDIFAYYTGVQITSAIHAKADGALAAGTVQQGPAGDMWRIKWVVVDGGAHGQSFTWALWFNPSPIDR